jgi:hypothetical protein
MASVAANISFAIEIAIPKNLISLIANLRLDLLPDETSTIGKESIPIWTCTVFGIAAKTLIAASWLCISWFDSVGLETCRGDSEEGEEGE